MPVNDLFRESTDPKDDQLALYQNYATAISLRHREPLSETSFIRHFFLGGSIEEPYAYGSSRDGFLLGNDIHGIFIPTHFAPKNLTGGYRLFKDLVSSKVPTALFITDDLVDTIKKMPGWHVLPIKIKTKFREENVTKTMVVNKWQFIGQLALYASAIYTRQWYQNGMLNLLNKKDILKKSVRQLVKEIAALLKLPGQNISTPDTLLDESTLTKYPYGSDSAVSNED